MLREELKKARPNATLYADSIQQLPPDITGLRSRIAGLALYPIKALGALKVNEARLGVHGLQTVNSTLADRMAMIVKKEKGVTGGRPYEYTRFSQREEGRLALVIPNYGEEGVLSYSAENMEVLNIPVQDLQSRMDEEVLIRVDGEQDVNSGVLENGPITDWVRSYLAKEETKYDPNDIFVAVRSNGFQRFVEERLSREGLLAQTCYSDGGQLLVVSSSTVEWMNGDLRKHYGDSFREISIDAFRPNIIFEGLPPNVEDLIGKVTIDVHAVLHEGLREERKDEASVLFADPCVRCDVTRVNGTTGRKPDKEPLKWLTGNRPPRLSKLNSATFGINGVASPKEGNKIIKVGSAFEITGEK